MSSTAFRYETPVFPHEDWSITFPAASWIHTRSSFATITRPPFASLTVPASGEGAAGADGAVDGAPEGAGDATVLDAAGELGLTRGASAAHPVDSVAATNTDAASHERIIGLVAHAAWRFTHDLVGRAAAATDYGRRCWRPDRIPSYPRCMNVLAVVSKAVFEKDARSGGKVFGVGDVWPTALYASQSPHLDVLAAGGSLFLVTVRPDDVLWLVGILESPKKSEKGWRSTPNTAPVRDVSRQLSRLRFSTGKGVSAERGKLGMSLQTPRQLTDADASLLRETPAPVVTAPTLTASPALAWRFDAYRARARWTKLTAKEKALLGPFQGLLEQNDEDEGGVELVDVVDTTTEKPVALYALWPVSAGALVDVATGAVLADVVESTFDAHGDDALRERMRAAHEAAAPGIHFAESVDYRGGRDTPKQAPAPSAIPDDPAVLAEMRALHAELDSRKETDVQATMRRIAVFGPKLFGEEVRPYPLRRPFEITATQRAYLELVVDHHDNRLDLWSHGLPWKKARHEESESGAPARCRASSGASRRFPSTRRWSSTARRTRCGRL
jgi:hypothetical protein